MEVSPLGFFLCFYWVQKLWADFLTSWVGAELYLSIILDSIGNYFSVLQCLTLPESEKNYIYILHQFNVPEHCQEMKTAKQENKTHQIHKRSFHSSLMHMCTYQTCVSAPIKDYQTCSKYGGHDSEWLLASQMSCQSLRTLLPQTQSIYWVGMRQTNTLKTRYYIFFKSCFKFWIEYSWTMKRNHEYALIEAVVALVVCLGIVLNSFPVLAEKKRIFQYHDVYHHHDLQQ